MVSLLLLCITQFLAFVCCVQKQDVLINIELAYQAVLIEAFLLLR